MDRQALKALGASPSTKFVIPTEFTRLLEPTDGSIVYKGDDIAPGTLNSILKQSGLKK